MPSAANGLTMLFGFRDAVSELQRQWKTAREKDIRLVSVNIQVDVGEMHRLRLGPADTPRFKFLYLDRLGQQTFAEMNRSLQRISTEADGEWDSPFVPAGFVTKRPDMVGRMIDDLRTTIFSSLELVVYRIDDPATGPRQVATLFSTKSVTAVEVQGVPTKVLFPEHLQLRN
ncbi:hypothetical protein CWS72_23930 [Telmatospirillum siberiense]|uniref:Uncharacterized protein n=2 Tax=Telmatospirillum siberiense TaxID=382514 RepID=A0A2N3PNI7_9PROT|nr:hypothetical protein CWS72_23930 [Telmatospirillum siberiense]